MRKKIVCERYVALALWPSALPGPFGQNVFLPCMPAAMSAHAGGGPAGGHRVRMLQAGGGPAGGPWVIWVIWVTVLNCMAMHALGHLGHCFLCDPNDPKHGHAWHVEALKLWVIWVIWSSF